MPGSAGDDPHAADRSTVAALGEHALIERIRRKLPPAPDWLAVGVGDDAAVYEPERNRLEVITTDACVDGVHFDRRFVPAAAIGHRAVAVNLSDLAAMGATPRLLTLSLAMPGDLAVADFDALVDGALALATRSGTHLIGGNITRTPGPLMVDVTAIGSVHRRRILRRAGARAGDYIFVSGTLGDARAGLALLAAPLAADAISVSYPVARYLQPEPRIRLGRLLGQSGAATSAVDLSDGLADGLAQIARSSGVGMEVTAAAVPLAGDTRAAWQARGADPLREALAGGDDYELLFTVRPRAAGRLRAVERLCRGLALTRIGTVTRTPGLWLVGSDGGREPLSGGYEHFSA